MKYTAIDESIDGNIYTIDSIDLINNQQMAMICSPFNVDLYFISKNTLINYTINLPKVDSESLIGNYF